MSSDELAIPERSGDEAQADLNDFPYPATGGNDYSVIKKGEEFDELMDTIKRQAATAESTRGSQMDLAKANIIMEAVMKKYNLRTKMEAVYGIGTLCQLGDLKIVTET